MNDYFKGEHSMEKLDGMNDVKELSEYTKNSILELIEYQMKFYSLYKKSLNKKINSRIYYFNIMKNIATQKKK
jgi:hypothetical protein